MPGIAVCRIASLMVRSTLAAHDAPEVLGREERGGRRRLREQSEESARRLRALGHRGEQRERVRVGWLQRRLVVGEVVVRELDLVAAALEVGERLRERLTAGEPAVERLRDELSLPERV